MSIQLSSIMAMFFVHKGGKRENRQFLAKMHQTAPNCISNSKIFPGVTPPYPHPWGGDAPPQTPPSLGASRLDMPLHPAGGQTPYKRTPNF